MYYATVDCSWLIAGRLVQFSSVHFRVGCNVVVDCSRHGEKYI